MDLQLGLPVLNFWNYKLRFGILCGALGISAASGVIATVVNGDSISEKISGVISPIQNFSDSYIFPRFKEISDGSVEIFKIYRKWSDTLISKLDVVNWIRQQKLSNIVVGFNALKSSFSSYAESIKNAISAVPDLTKNLSIDFIKKLLVQISEYSVSIKNLLDFLSKTFYTLFQQSLGSESAEGKQLLENLKNLISSNKAGELFQSMGKVITNNSSTVKGLSGDQMSEILMHALKAPEKFMSTVKSLESSNSKNELHKWGNYSSGQELVSALMNNSISDYIFKALEGVASTITQCKQGETCTSSDVLSETSKLLGKKTVEVLFSWLSASGNSKKEK